MHFSPVPMHIPDGFLSLPVSLAFWVVSLVVIWVSLKHINGELGDRKVPLMGVLAAAIFAGQMLNFAVAGGTSGHLLGAAIATILMGPWAAVVIMTSVVCVQALIFQDGGLVVLGANLFNMAIVGVFFSYMVYRIFQIFLPGSKIGLVLSGFAAAWASIFIASLSCGLQLAVSGTSPASLAIPAMGVIHAIIGIGEGLITAGALAFIHASRPDLLSVSTGDPVSSKTILAVGAILTMLLLVISPLASNHPDGLEWVAEKLGFIEAAQQPVFKIIPDYVLPGVHDEALATIIAGIIGAGIVFSISTATAARRARKIQENQL